MRFIPTNNRPAPVRKGFTLIEAAIVTVVVGVGIVGMLQLLAAGTLANTESTELTTALNLAGNVHEMSMAVPYKDIMTMDGLQYSPPVDSKKQTISALTNWKQVVTVNYVDHDRITVTVPKTQPEPTARVTVTISHGTRPVYTTSWVMAAAEWPLP